MTKINRPARPAAGVRTRAAALSTGAHPRTPAMPVLFSLPVHEKLELPPRAKLIPKIESGEIDHLDFTARVFGTGKIRNPYVFKDEDLAGFAASFEGQPFLRNHDTSDIDARDGTIVEATLDGAVFTQTIRLTTRRGMLDFIEGKIDRFSIGWFYDDITCSICQKSWFRMECAHWPGRVYDGHTMKLIFVNPKGKETSAVNTPAVEGTRIITQLQDYKLEVIGGSVTAATHARRASASTARKGAIMPKKKVIAAASDVLEETDLEDQIDEQTAAALDLQGANEAIADLREKGAQANALLVEQCRALLDSSLSASKLPAASQAAMRKPFDKQLTEGRPFLATELQEAIQDKRAELSELQAPDQIQGPGRNQIGSMFSSQDQYRIALEDLFGMERQPEDAKARVHKLRGIQDAYLLATGDVSFMGGFYPEFALVTANFPGIVANVMNKMLIMAWKDLEHVYGWWKEIVTIEHFTNLNQVGWVKTGTISSLPTVLERGEYTELPIGDIKETSEWGKQGGYIPLTIEAVLRDDLRAFTRMPREAALAGMRNVSEQVSLIFTQAAGAGPTMNDGGALFNSTAQTTAGGHLNLLTTALGTDYVAWNVVATAMYKKKLMVKNATGYYGTGKPQGMKPNVCLVPADLITQAEALFIPRWEAPTHLVPTSGGTTFGGHVKPIAVPDWTDATDWAAVNNLIPGVMIGEIFGILPQIFSASSEIDPAMFANDESRVKVRQFLNVGVADDMPLAKNNVA